MTIVKAISEYSRGNGKFFCNETLKYWDSKILYQSYNDVNRCFITSEPDFEGNDRRFTIRQFSDDYRSVRTVGEFRQYATYKEAEKALKEVV